MTGLVAVFGFLHTCRHVNWCVHVCTRLRRLFAVLYRGACALEHCARGGRNMPIVALMGMYFAGRCMLWYDGYGELIGEGMMDLIVYRLGNVRSV